MRRFLLAIAGLLLMGQSSPSTETVPPLCTVAQLAAGTCAPAKLGTTVRISDGDVSPDLNCASGTGAVTLFCRFNGTNWTGTTNPDDFGGNNYPIFLENVGAPSNDGLTVNVPAGLFTGFRNIIRPTPLLPNPVLSGTNFFPFTQATFEPARIGGTNNQNYAILQLPNETCMNSTGNWPSCPLSKTNTGALLWSHWKEGISQQGAGFGFKNSCLGSGDCIGLSFDQNAYAGAPAGSDEGSITLRVTQTDTFSTKPASLSMGSAINTLSGASQGSVVWNASANDAFKKFGEDSYLVFNDAALGNCEDTDGNGTVDAACRTTLDAGGPDGVTAMTGNGVWTAAEAGDIANGVRFDPAIGFTGYCFALSTATHVDGFGGSSHLWWLPILYGPTDSIDPYVTGGVADASVNFDSTAQVDDATEVITATAHGFGANGTAVHVTLAGTLPSGIVVSNSTSGVGAGGLWARILSVNTIALYSTKANAEADASRINLTDAAGTGRVGTGHSCYDPQGCTATTFQTFFATANASGTERMPGVPNSNYVPGKFSASYTGTSADDDGTIAACERIARVDDVALDSVLGDPTDTTATIVFNPTAKPDRNIPSTTDSEIGYPAASQTNGVLSLLWSGTRGNTQDTSIINVRVLGQTVNSAFTAQSNAAVGQGRTLFQPFFIRGAIGSDTRGAPPNSNKSALLTHWTSDTLAADFVQDDQRGYLVLMPTAEWGTTDSDAMEYAVFDEIAGEGTGLQWDSLEGIGRINRRGKECSGGTEVGKYCRVNGDCAGGGTCGTVTTNFNQMMVRNRTDRGLAMWADGGPTCDETCEDVGLTCVVATDLDAAANTSVACTSASDADPGYLCKCRGNQ